MASVFPVEGTEVDKMDIEGWAAVMLISPEWGCFASWNKVQLTEM